MKTKKKVERMKAREMKSIIREDFELLEKTYSQDLEKLKGKSIYITGSYGMITSYLCKFLIYLMERYELKLYLQGRKPDRLQELYGDYTTTGRVSLITLDFEKNEMPDVEPNYIIHAASAASTKYFIECPVDVLRPNTVGTWNLLKYAQECGAEKFLFFSSGSIYGEGGVDKEELTENDYGIVDPLNERSCYIESKRLSEQMCRAFWKQYGVPTSIIRICHTYGPTFDPEHDTRVVPRTIKKILNNEDVEIYKDPHSVIQYTYIADMTAAILLVLLKGDMGEAYNSGGDEIVKMDDVIEWMFNADPRIKSKLIQKEIDGNYHFAQGKGLNFIKLSNKKIKGIGWKQLYTNEEGFTRTVQSYLA